MLQVSLGCLRTDVREREPHELNLSRAERSRDGPGGGAERVKAREKLRDPVRCPTKESRLYPESYQSHLVTFN